jgi:hypothetical protein
MIPRKSRHENWKLASGIAYLRTEEPQAERNSRGGGFLLAELA